MKIIRNCFEWTKEQELEFIKNSVETWVTNQIIAQNGEITEVYFCRGYTKQVLYKKEHFSFFGPLFCVNDRGQFYYKDNYDPKIKHSFNTYEIIELHDLDLQGNRYQGPAKKISEIPGPNLDIQKRKDLFAAAALQGLLSRPEQKDPLLEKDLCLQAWQYAEQMICLDEKRGGSW